MPAVGCSRLELLGPTLSSCLSFSLCGWVCTSTCVLRFTNEMCPEMGSRRCANNVSCPNKLLPHTAVLRHAMSRGNWGWLQLASCSSFSQSGSRASDCACLTGRVCTQSSRLDTPARHRKHVSAQKRMQRAHTCAAEHVLDTLREELFSRTPRTYAHAYSCNHSPENTAASSVPPPGTTSSASPTCCCVPKQAAAVTDRQPG